MRSSRRRGWDANAVTPRRTKTRPAASRRGARRTRAYLSTEGLQTPAGQGLIINSHRAAGQMWMAAFRQAWHFSPSAPATEDGRWLWRTATEELRATLALVIGKHLGRAIKV